MFERRLKIFLALLVVVTLVLVLRAAFVQVVQKDQWSEKANATLTKSRSIETSRGRIIDIHDNPVAIDRPCMDACVNFRALTSPPDAKWVTNIAIKRLRDRLREDGYRDLSSSRRKELVAAETGQVFADIKAMWKKLSEVSKVPLEEIEQTRDDVVRKVSIRRKAIWDRNYKIAMKKFEQREPSPAWRRWILEDGGDRPTEEQFTTPVEEELQDHPILLAVATEVQIELRKHIEEYPGLVLRPGVQRYYPYGDAGCHVIGNLARVNRDDLKADPNLGKDELRQYYPNDRIGRNGIEKLAEQVLRGSRGRIETIEGREGEVGRIDAIPGRDVQMTIDIELSYDIANMFHYAKVDSKSAANPDAKLPPEIVPMHGAAVLIDVPTSEVRALVSYPTFDLNDFNEKYAERVADELGNPLLDRATELQLVPGSTVKPMVGLGAIAEGLIGVNDGIECTGYLTIRGQRFSHAYRCWTASKWASLPPEKRPPPEHHQIPWSDPHVGHHGNPNGFLSYSDALQRSCNVYFENLGDRLRIEGLTRWYGNFGLGRPTGLGIRERSGLLFRYFKPYGRAPIAWHGAIGQGRVEATPIQMANVAATIARGGIWMRPKLLRDSQGVSIDAEGPDRVDLHLPPEAIAAAREGMIKVVNTPGGTGTTLHRDDLVVAGKTGTATASEFKVKKRNKNGEIELGPDKRPLMVSVRPSTRDDPNPDALWYRGGTDGKTLNHAWFIGFAPANNPKIAFCVLIEYGVSGGAAAGSIAKELLDACIERGYLPHNPRSNVAKTLSLAQ